MEKTYALIFRRKHSEYDRTKPVMIAPAMLPHEAQSLDLCMFSPLKLSVQERHVMRIHTARVAAESETVTNSAHDMERMRKRSRRKDTYLQYLAISRG